MKEIKELKDICSILKNAKTIAVVGLSGNPEITSRQIAETLIYKGYEVVGVNPNISESGGITIYPDLASIPFPIDIVDVFRRAETIHEIIPDVLRVKPKALWLQQGIRNDDAVRPVLENNISVIQDKCIAVYWNLCKSSFQK